MPYGQYDTIIMPRKYGEASREQSCGGFFHARTEVIAVGYRRVSYLEQVWYILRYKVRGLFRKEDPRAK